MTISNELLTTTLHSIMKDATDQLFQSTPILDQLRKLGGVKTDEWGIEITEPIITTTHSTPTAFPTGFEEANTTVRDAVDQRFRFAAADLGQQIVITRKEEEENKGDKAVVKIAEARTRAALGGQRRVVNSQILSGDEVVGIAAGLNTLYGHRTAATGFLEGRVAASQVNEVGGVSKAQNILGLRNQFQDVGDDFSANGRRAMDLIQIACRTRSEFGTPNLIIASEAMFANYKDTLFPNERWTPKDVLDAGRLALMYGGAVIEPDIEMPTSGTNDFEASAYFLNTQAFYLAFWTGNEFDLGEFRDMTGRQAGRMAWLYTKLQLCVKSLASLGFLADGNTN